MSWLKPLLMLCIVSFSVFLGYISAQKYRERKKYFEQFYLFNERYLSELNYARKPIGEFLNSHEYTGEFADHVKEFSQKRKFSVKQNFLNQDEIKFCEDYFQMLGKGDSKSQNAYFSIQRNALAQKKEESEKEAKSRGELYLKLGLLAGLAVIILIA